MSDEPIDLLVSGNLVNVDAGAVSELFVVIDDGRIVAFGERLAARELDAEYITPGLIGVHMYVESSTVTLSQYADAVVPQDVMSVIHDSHEIVNVSGVIGAEAMMADATWTPLEVHFTVPSSAPATVLQDGDAALDAKAVDALLGEDEVVALGEMMSVPGVVTGDDSVHEEIRVTRDHGLTVGGHAPRVRGNDLQTVARYLNNNYESINLAETREKVKAGLRIYPREGFASKNLADMVGLVDEVGSRWFSLCTDDKDVVGLVEQGGVNFAARKATRPSIDPVEAMQMVTVNTTKSYELPFGRIRLGVSAGLVLLSDL